MSEALAKCPVFFVFSPGNYRSSDGLHVVKRKRNNRMITTSIIQDLLELEMTRKRIMESRSRKLSTVTINEQGSSQKMFKNRSEDPTESTAFLWI